MYEIKIHIPEFLCIELYSEMYCNIVCNIFVIGLKLGGDLSQNAHDKSMNYRWVYFWKPTDLFLLKFISDTKNEKKAGECCQTNSIENFVEKLGNDAQKMVGFFIEKAAR